MLSLRGRADAAWQRALARLTHCKYLVEELRLPDRRLGATRSRGIYVQSWRGAGSIGKLKVKTEP
jgi:hypothetical protein